MDKQKDITTADKLTQYDLANLFYVYEQSIENKLSFVYNINRTINFENTSTIPETKFSYYRVMEGDMWTTIAWKQYGNYRLWWVICKFNGITDPVANDPVAGDVIKLLNPDIVKSILGSIKNG